MRTCANCYFCSECSEEDKANGRCEYYYPVYGGESVLLREYEESLEERAGAYREIVEEYNED